MSTKICDEKKSVCMPPNIKYVNFRTLKAFYNQLQQQSIDDAPELTSAEHKRLKLMTPYEKLQFILKRSAELGKYYPRLVFERLNENNIKFGENKIEAQDMTLHIIDVCGRKVDVAQQFIQHHGPDIVEGREEKWVLANLISFYKTFTKLN